MTNRVRLAVREERSETKRDGYGWFTSRIKGNQADVFLRLAFLGAQGAIYSALSAERGQGRTNIDFIFSKGETTDCPPWMTGGIEGHLNFTQTKLGEFLVRLYVLW